MTTLASDPVTVPILLWRRLLRELARRGAGRRETGAFLLARRHGRRVSAYVCYDDLDREACQTGAITFHAAGYAALWAHCRNWNLEVIADVHTHPGSHVGQSWIDQTNPMVPVIGHVALIVPHFARVGWRSLASVGVYEYLGNLEWRAYGSSARAPAVRLSVW